MEQLGVERSRRAIASAELVLAVVDGAVPEDPEEGSLLADVARCGVPWLLVFTKRDMAGGLRTAGAVFPAGEGPLAPPAAVVSLSSVTGEGLEDLGNAVAALFPAGDPGEAGSLLTDRRQEDAAAGPWTQSAGFGGPGDRNDPGCGAHRRGGGPGCAGRAVRPHGEGGDCLPHFFPILCGKITANRKCNTGPWKT